MIRISEFRLKQKGKLIDSYNCIEFFFFFLLSDILIADREVKASALPFSALVRLLIFGLVAFSLGSLHVVVTVNTESCGVHKP